MFGLSKVMAGFLAAALIGLGTAGWLLKKAWSDNATLEANVAQYEQALAQQNEQYRRLIQENADREAELVRNAGKKADNREVVEKIKYVTRTVQKEAPPGDCVNQPVPGRIMQCLREETCDPGDGPGTGVPAGDTDAADS